jgi:hypothetical protein
MNWVFQGIQRTPDRRKTGRRPFLHVVAVLGALVAFTGMGTSAEGFKEDTPYTVASLEGDYGFLGHYSGDVARLVGTVHFDGKGNMTSGSARVVIAGGTVKAVTNTGTYTMNPDGTGTIAITVFGVGTPPPVVNEDFVITRARFINGIKIATEVQDAQEEPSVVVTDAPSFVTHTYTRRPEREEHK